MFIYLKGIFLLKVCFSDFIPFSMHPHNRNPSVIFTTENLQAPGDLRVEYEKRSDYHRVSEAVPSIMARSWSWGSQIVVKKKKKNKQSLVVSYIGVCKINSLHLFIKNLCIRKISHLKP